MANINSVTEVIDASGQKRLPNGNFFFLIASTAAVNVNLTKGGSNEIFQNAIGGLQVKRVRGWDYAYIVGAPGATIQYMYGIGAFREDDTTLQQQIATVAGTVQTVIAPAVTLSDLTPIVTAAATQAAVVPQNLLRRAFTLFSDPRNVGDTFIFLRKTGGTKDIGILQPGTTLTFTGTYGLDYRAVAGGDTIYIAEES